MLAFGLAHSRGRTLILLFGIDFIELDELDTE